MYVPFKFVLAFVATKWVESHLSFDVAAEASRAQATAAREGTSLGVCL